MNLEQTVCQPIPKPIPGLSILVAILLATQLFNFNFVLPSFLLLPYACPCPVQGSPRRFRVGLRLLELELIVAAYYTYLQIAPIKKVRSDLRENAHAHAHDHDVALVLGHHLSPAPSF